MAVYCPEATLARVQARRCSDRMDRALVGAVVGEEADPVGGVGDRLLEQPLGGLFGGVLATLLLAKNSVLKLVSTPAVEVRLNTSIGPETEAPIAGVHSLSLPSKIA